MSEMFLVVYIPSCPHALAWPCEVSDNLKPGECLAASSREPRMCIWWAQGCWASPGPRDSVVPSRLWPTPRPWHMLFSLMLSFPFFPLAVPGPLQMQE